MNGSLEIKIDIKKTKDQRKSPILRIRTKNWTTRKKKK
jgi:hypothetical protein